MSRTKNMTGVITMDLRPFIAAFKKVGDAVAKLAEAFTPEGRLRRDRHAHGGNGTDARRWPEMWQSASCSAWLHESCPSEAHCLGCTCGCHGRRP